MFSAKRLFCRYGNIYHLNPLQLIHQPITSMTPIGTTNMNGILIQQANFASAASGTKSGTKRKTSSSTKGKNKSRKTASKSKTKSRTKSTATAKAKAKAKTKTKKRVRSKPKAKPKTVIQSLSKPQQKLLKEYPDPSKPKRPPPSLYYFTLDQPTTRKVTEVAKLWNTLDDTTKNEYKEKAKLKYPEYKAKLSEYKLKQKESIDEWLVTAQQLKDSRPPSSGYTGFIKENKNEFIGVSNTRDCNQIVKNLAQKWRNMDSYEKNEYKTKYSDLYREWKERVASYYHDQ